MSQNESVAKGPVVAALTGEWASLDQLLDGLPDEQWVRPTCLPGWRVTDVVAHLIGTESMLAGDAAPETGVDVKTLPHVRNDIGAFNEQWVQALREEPPAEVLRRFREVIARRTEQLEELPQSDFDAPSWTPAGQATYARFMRIRLYDCWMHEQDVRVALAVPGNEVGTAAEGALGEVTRALGYIVGKLAGAPDGVVVRFELTGPLERRLTVAVDGRAKVVDEAPEPPTATLRMTSSLFMRLTGGRKGDLAGVGLDGDTALARQVLDNLAFTM
ncbi:maleylpyruvate isomerase family mycothiol-dependent enzyme [Actinomadura sp. DC4]|uniref:maleylpyruvate isomerase family mycothiol-dependent enzyme n=1 Tax=Actinomadura sp. DC4 TaxID=3055069 RepID=UPI0025B20649|nr:maleylpyruvate isomerase family mycothiol-dependent enzyme [Actinomadura sp. DC4]MDN3351983.1 maleylpyruvate isomerase family mycothiol-dependent enzyme [Actinomadura sp. DC4]